MARQKTSNSREWPSAFLDCHAAEEETRRKPWEAESHSREPLHQALRETVNHRGILRDGIWIKFVLCKDNADKNIEVEVRGET